MTPIKLNQLEMLVAVADEGSFSKAALALDCTQSRVSHALGELERTLGARLFERGAGGSVPTAAGRRALHHARQMLALAEAMRQPGAGPVGVVRLACFRSIVTHVVPHLLALVERSHPGIRIEIDDQYDNADEIAAAVLAGRAELGIGCAPFPDALLAYPLLSDDYVLVLPAGCATRKPFRWPQLGALPLLAPVNARTAAAIDALRAAGMPAKVSRRLVSDSGIMAMVASGRGFAVMPQLSVQPLPEGVKLVAPPLHQQRRFGVLAQAATARDEAVRAVLAALRRPAALADLPAVRSGICVID